MKLLQQYLEYLAQQERKIAANNGQTNFRSQTEIVKPKIKNRQIPLWLQNDLPYDNIKNNNDTIFKVFKNNYKIYDYDRIKFPQNLKRARLVAIPDGTLYWANSENYIHQEIIAYMMCAGHIPMLEQHSDYKWQSNSYSAQTFLCLEMMYGELYMAESYRRNTSKIILEESSAPQLYKTTLRKINFKPEDIISNYN